LAKQRLASTAGANLRGNPSGLLTSGGRALQEPLLGEMNTALGYDFSQVRIHADGEAQRLAGQLGARAVTVGQSTYVRPAWHRPGTTEGRELLAHELAHTVQQRSAASVLESEAAISGSEQGEREAEAASKLLRHGKRLPRPQFTTLPVLSLQPKLMIDGSTVSKASSYYKRHDKDPTAKAVLDILIASKQSYQRSSDSLDFELKVRTNFVRAANELSESQLAFPSHADEGPLIKGLKLKHWETKGTGISLKKGSRPSQGIREIFEAARTEGVEAECNTALHLVWYKGILDSAVSEDQFDRLFDYRGTGQYEFDISGYDSSSPGALLPRMPAADYLPGDYRFFENPQFNPKTPAWRGENVIQMPRGFYGHPGGTKSKEEWISFLNKHRGEDAKLKAFLSDDAQRFDWDMLKRLMETK